MIRTRALRTGLACVVAGGALTVGAPAAGARPANPSPIDRARQAASTVNYTGTITVRWVDHTGSHTSSMPAEASAGVVRVNGEAKMAATSSQVWAFRDGDWDLMSPVGLSQLPIPSTGKYRYSSAPGPAVAGRPTELVQLTVGSRLDERWYLDLATGLLLRREQLSRTGAEVRSVGFDSITLRPATTRVATPVATVDLRPQKVSHLQASLVAPDTLAGRYRKVGMFRRSTALQVVYSDGVHGLSVFEQPGRLDRASVPPGGQPVTLGPAGGLQWVYAGGEVVVWQAGGSTFTVVGDGAPEDVLAASRSVPSTRSHSVLGRLRRACSQVVDAVSGP